MGCDIHAFVEKKENDRWWQWAEIRIDRNYTLFSIMAGVRSNGEPVLFVPKGIPSELSSRVRDKYYRTGFRLSLPKPYWHMPSWLTLREVNQAQHKYMEPDGDPNPDLSAILAVMDELNRSHDDVRLVFWFDN